MNVWEMTSAGERFQAQHRPSDVYWTRQRFWPQRTSFDMKGGSSLHRCLHLIGFCLWNLLCPILNHTYGCYKHDVGAVSGYRCRDCLGLRAVWGVLRTGLVGGGSHRCGNAVGFWTARYLMGLCTLSGSGGWRSAWLEPLGKSCLEKNHFHMGQAVWLLRTSREEGVWISFAVDLHLWRVVYVYKLFKVNGRHTLCVALIPLFSHHVHLLYE